VLSVLRRLDIGRRPAARILVVDLHDFLARGLVAGLRLCGRLGIDWFALTPAHNANRTPRMKLSA